ncbi:MAG: acyl-CoA dehydrogenase family protein, partial [Thermoanaerobaculia bacterium]
MTEARRIDPDLLVFLPMLYVAWSDGDLSPAEMGEICRRIDGDCQQLLGPWLDPRNPPSAVELQGMLATVRGRAENLDAEEKLNLTSLGLALAQAGDRQVSDEERQALSEIETVLGVTGFEAARQMLATRRPAEPLREPEPAFVAAALQRLLDGEEADHRDRLRTLLSQPRFQRQDGWSRQEYREQVLSWCRELAAEGYGAASFPSSCGGSENLGRFVATFETLAFHDLSLLIKFGVQFGLFGGSILNLGTERHHRELLPRIGSLELPGCFAMTETSHGSNVADLETVARYDPETREFDLHTPHDGARKDYIGNAACHGRMATVFAQLEIGGHAFGVHAFVVPIRDDDGDPCPGVSIEDCGGKLGLNGVDNGRLWFEHVRVPRHNLLDRFAQVAADGSYTSSIPSPSRRFFTMLGTLVGGRVSVALAALSAAKSALAIAVRYGAQRRQFGPPDESEIRLLDYRTHQRRLMPRLAATYALHFALGRLRDRYLASSDEDRRGVETDAAGLKALSTWHTTDAVQVCRECCGGQGYLAVNRFADLKADTEVFTTFEGDNVVLLQLVAKSLLSDYQRQFGDMGFVGLMRFVAKRAAAAVAELNPITTRLTDDSHLRGRDFQLGAFRWREQHLLATVAQRLKKRIDRGVEVSQAMIECQDHLVATARAYVERVVLEAFTEAVAAIGEDDVRAALEPVCDLYALSR